MKNIIPTGSPRKRLTDDEYKKLKKQVIKETIITSGISLGVAAIGGFAIGALKAYADRLNTEAE